MKATVKHYLLLLVLVLCSGKVCGQNPVSENIKVTTIHSEILNQDREILIFSTKGNIDDTNDFPTIYLLDGRENFLLVVGLISNLVRADVLPDLNLVGINNYDYDREYDFSTKSLEEVHFKTGGASNFQKFISDELFPYISTSKTSSTYKLLIGHSFGGSFGLNMLLENPKSFSSAILVDPSVWWNDSEVIKRLKNNPKIIDQVPVYYSRSGKDSLSLKLFDSLEKVSGSKNSIFDRYPMENHISVLPYSIIKGLKYVFGPFIHLESLYNDFDFNEIKKTIREVNRQYNTNILPRVRPIASAARNLTREAKYDDAISMLSYLEELHPKDIMVLNFLAEAYEKSGDIEKAKDTYNRSLKIAKMKKSPMVRWIEKRLAKIDN
ncbi:alpha/beta hydrolase-fold protein [Winogradskyella sp.]|uniref:alpha/beta hydrolase-fold protein n=1 Tax=Winogradskyella sp. TaxID=1883156 RepID=UPI00261A065A|nr:alpha/beta hydrolase-fold protein [Winogradskyella sp.]